MDPEAQFEATSKSGESSRRRRWVKVDVSEVVFDKLHQMATQSRMRVQPYLRRFLAEACPFSTPSADPAALTYSSDVIQRE